MLLVRRPLVEYLVRVEGPGAGVMEGDAVRWIGNGSGARGWDPVQTTWRVAVWVEEDEGTAAKIYSRGWNNTLLLQGFQPHGERRSAC